MCIYMNVCIYIYVYIYIHIYTYICLCISYTYVFICVQKFIQTCIHICIYHSKEPDIRKLWHKRWAVARTGRLDIYTDSDLHTHVLTVPLAQCRVEKERYASPTATHLQRTATQCNTLATHCNTLQHMATHYHTLQLEEENPPPNHARTPTLSQKLSHTHIRPPTHSYTLSITHTQKLAPTQTHTHMHTHTNTHTHTYTQLSLSRSHTHTHTHTLTHIHTHTHTKGSRWASPIGV